MSPQTTDSPNFFILILFAFLLKALFDFKSLGGFNYPLLIKLLYLIMLASISNNDIIASR